MTSAAAPPETARRPGAVLDAESLAALRRAWTVVCARADLDRDADAVAAAADDLLTRYREPHRRYHGASHLAGVLAVLEWLCEPTAPPVAVELAVWFHDAVYDTRRTDNEARSAGLARRSLTRLGAHPALVEEVATLVEMTAAHVATSAEGRLLMDADLWILGAPDEVYDRYVDGTRFEYGHVPDGAWRDGRRRVLRAFLERPSVFHHPRLAGADAQMRRNLARELASLTPASPAADAVAPATEAERHSTAVAPTPSG